MGPLKIQELSQAPWLPGSRLPVHTWLVPDEDAARLRALFGEHSDSPMLSARPAPPRE